MTAPDPAATSLRKLALAKQAELDTLRITARAVWLTVEAETTRHQAIYARIRSLQCELSDLGMTMREARGR